MIYTTAHGLVAWTRLPAIRGREEWDEHDGNSVRRRMDANGRFAFLSLGRHAFFASFDYHRRAKGYSRRRGRHLDIYFGSVKQERSMTYVTKFRFPLI